MKQMFKKLILASILSLSALTALASPSPKQVEKALAAGDYQAARSMTSEVLREHPNSAKAHLFNAYLLQHVDRNKQAANEELKQVVRLDKTGDVTGSALFGKVVTEIEAPSPVQRKYIERQSISQTASVAPVSYAQPSTSGSHKIVYILLITGVIAGGIGYLMFRKTSTVIVQEREIYQPSAHYTRGDTVSHNTRSSVDFDSRERAAVRNTYVSQPSQVYVQPVPQQAPQQGMGAMGTAASVAGGVVAGNLLTDALRGGHSHRSDYEYDRPSRSTYREPEPAYEAPAKVDYEVRESSFSSGRESSWEPTPSSSSSSSDSGGGWGDSSSSSSSDSGGGDW